MAILFKDNGGDLLTDIDLVNPYTNAIKNADNVVGMVDKMQGMFAAQTEKNRLMEKEAVTGAAMADIMAGRKPNLEGIDPTTVDFNTLMNFAQKKTMDDATVEHQSVMQIEAARSAKANETLKGISEANQQLNREAVTQNRKDALSIQKDAQSLKDKKHEESLINDTAAGLLAETTSYLLSIEDPTKRQEEANRIRTEFSADKSNKAAVIVGQKLFGETNRLVNDTRASGLKDMNLALGQLADSSTSESSRTEIASAFNLSPRSGIELYAPEAGVADKRNVMTIGEDGKKANNVYDIAEYAMNVRPQSGIDRALRAVYSKTKVDNLNKERLAHKMESIKHLTESEQVAIIAEGVVSDLTSAINASTGEETRRLTNELIEFERLIKNGTRSTAMKRKIKDFTEATKNLVYTPSNILKP